MSHSNKELRDLIREAEDYGAQLVVTYDTRAAVDEGRAIIDMVRFLPTTLEPFNKAGPYAVGSITAVELLMPMLATVRRYRHQIGKYLDGEGCFPSQKGISEPLSRQIIHEEQRKRGMVPSVFALNIPRL